MNIDVQRTMVMNKVRSFENLRTTVIKLKNGPDNWQGFGANLPYNKLVSCLQYRGML